MAFAAGDTVEFTQQFGEYPPSDGWTLAVRLVRSTPIDAVVTDDEAQTYTVLFSAASTAAIVSEEVTRLVGYVTGAGAYAGERHTVIDQYVTIFPNLATATADEILTDAARNLALAQARLSELLATGIESYSIGSRSATRRKLSEARADVAHWRYQVWLERNPTKATASVAMAFNGPR